MSGPVAAARPRRRLALAGALAALRLATLALAAALASTAALAHFAEGAKPRTILLVDDDAHGLVAYMRLPAPLLYAQDIVAAQQAQRPFAAEPLAMARVGNAMTFLIDRAALAADPAGFAARLGASLSWRQNGAPVAARALAWRLHADQPEGAFATAEDAKTALAGPAPRTDPNFGAAYVDVALALEARFPRADLQLKSAHPSLPLPPAVSIDNHVRDLRAGMTASLTSQGQLQDWVAVEAGSLGMVRDGALRFVGGVAPVLLVACMALGAGTARRLALLAAAFTLGHVAALVAATIGPAPTAAWVAPAVEAARAATVVYAAWAAWAARRGRATPAWVFAAMGLPHGVAFALDLAAVFGPEAPARALAAFTLGLEIGQLAALAAAVGLAALIGLAPASARDGARLAGLVACAAAAALWTAARSVAILA